MLPALAAPVLIGGGVSVGEGLAWATVIMGSWAALHRPSRFQTPDAMPPLTGLPGSAEQLQQIQDWINGARLPSGGPGGSPPGGPPAWAVAAGIAGAVGSAGAGIWEWLNRPRQPNAITQWPGLGPNQIVKAQLSPRFARYQVWFTGKVPYGGGYVSSAGWMGQGSTDMEFPPYDGYHVTGYTVRETGQGDLNGGKVCYLEVTVFGVTSTGQAGKAIFYRQLEVGTGSVEISPTEGDQSGWVTQINQGPPANWATDLPEREPAIAPPLHLPVIAPGSLPGQPGKMPLPGDLEESLGDDAQKPIWEWPPGVGTGVKPTPGTGTDSKPLVPPPAPGIPIPIAPAVPKPSNPQMTGPDGKPIQLPLPLPPVTDPDSHFVGGGEVSGAPARADLLSIAKEITRVEGKMAKMMGPSGANPGSESILDDIRAAFEFWRDLMNLLKKDVPGTTWEVTAPCNKDSAGNPVKLKYDLPPGDYLPAILARVNALMAFEGQTVGWRKPVCKLGNPANVQVFAYGNEPAPTGGQFKKQRTLEKVLSYRMAINEGEEDAALQSLANHWYGFTWEAGRTIVEWFSETHPPMKVWASTLEEGTGVIEHALAHVGISPNVGYFVETVSRSARSGRSGTVTAARATVRTGPSGLPREAHFPPDPTTM